MVLRFSTDACLWDNYILSTCLKLHCSCSIGVWFPRITYAVQIVKYYLQVPAHVPKIRIILYNHVRLIWISKDCNKSKQSHRPENTTQTNFNVPIYTVIHNSQSVRILLL